MHQSRSGGGTAAALVTLVASGAIGFHLGYTRFPHWQVPVESAQVLAGIVAYPHETPFYVHHVSLWTLLHQVCAVFLRAGVSEVALSRILSGVLGMLSLQALAMFTFAFSRRAFHVRAPTFALRASVDEPRYGGQVNAIGVALLLFVSEVTYAGAVYPIFLMGVPFTYGVVGLSLIVLVAALLGSGLQRAGAFLLGLAPAVHTGLAFWLWLIVAVSLLLERRRRVPRGTVLALLMGLGVAAASYAVHAVVSAGVPDAQGALDRRYLDAFVAFWDGHRRPVAPGELAVLLNVAGFSVATIWLRWFRDGVTTSAAFLLRFTQVSAALSLALVPLTWAPPDRLPVLLLVLMPGRVLNIVAMTFPALLFGLLGASPGGWRGSLMVVMAVALLLGDESMLWRIFPAATRPWMIPTEGITFVIAAALVAGEAIERGRRRKTADTVQRRWRGAWLVPALAMLVFVSAAVVAYRVPESRDHIFIDRHNNAVLAAASAGSGLLLTMGDAHLMQLRTRRPMLVDTGALDTIPYTPGSGPALDRILRDIYGVDLFNPPPQLRWTGRLLEGVHKEHWERNTSQDWQRIRRVYRVTQVLTAADWQLDLPIVAGDRRFLLYAIPE